MEAFEKELGDSKPGPEDGADGELVDDADLGDDPFAVHADGGVAREGVATEMGREPWLGSDRDYTYSEVCHSTLGNASSY